MATKEEILTKLYSLKNFGIKPGLDRTKHILSLISNPQDDFKTILIAGTNGKGSTANYMASILIEAGYRVGLYTSPHILKFNERIKVNNREISDDGIVNLSQTIFNKVDFDKDFLDNYGNATFFEVTTAMSYKYFSDEKVDIAIVETGLGGRLDCTNVINVNNQLASVITNIGMDHKEYLGNTLEEIANEKAGIINNNSILICSEENYDLKIIIKNKAQEKTSKVFFINDDFYFEEGKSSFNLKYEDYELSNLKINLTGKHQIKNASLAVMTMLKLKDKINISDENIRDGILKTEITARYETVSDNPKIILDVAHNVPASLAIAETLKNETFDKLILVVGMMNDKDIDGFTKSFNDYKPETIYVFPENLRTMDSNVLTDNVNDFLKVKEGIELAIKKANINDIILITGSFYTIEEAKIYLNEINNEQ